MITRTLDLTEQEINLLRQLVVARYVQAQSFIKQADPHTAPESIKLSRSDAEICAALAHKLDIFGVTHE